ncbi:hypothetical protein ABID58_006366 [Bradyrhizobium sp. S3.2.6]
MSFLSCQRCLSKYPSSNLNRSLQARMEVRRTASRNCPTASEMRCLLQPMCSQPPPGIIFIIDEPERHLHRSIISPLLTLLFERRNDCAYIVSTHDVLLPIDNPSARTLLLRSCTYSGPNSIRGWDADLVVTPDEIDDTLKKDILGSRRNLLFVEGEEHSLDRPIYSLLFPTASVICKAELPRCRACGIRHPRLRRTSLAASVRYS